MLQAKLTQECSLTPETSDQTPNSDNPLHSFLCCLLHCKPLGGRDLCRALKHPGHKQTSNHHSIIIKNKLPQCSQSPEPPTPGIPACPLTFPFLGLPLTNKVTLRMSPAPARRAAPATACQPGYKPGNWSPVSQNPPHQSRLSVRSPFHQCQASKKWAGLLA